MPSREKETNFRRFSAGAISGVHRGALRLAALG